MTFLNPDILWAAFAIAIPIIVHLFNFRRPKKVLFSNISMVKEVQKSVVRRLRLRQWLLLASRILAILALVFVFANPVILRDSEVNLKSGSSSVAVVLDNSYSMESGNEKGFYWPQAQNLARKIIENYSKEDEFLVMTSSNLRLNYNFSDQSQAIEDLKKLEVKQNLTPYTELLKLQDEVFYKSSDNNNRVVYFLSDFQTSTVLADSMAAVSVDSGIQFYFIPMATRGQRNVYITDHEILNRVIDKEARLNLAVGLVNDGEEPIKEVSVSIVNEKVTEPGIRVPELVGRKDTVVSFRASGTGWQSGIIEIADPNVYFDNERFFSYYVPEKEKLLVVEGQVSSGVRAIYKALAAADQFDVDFISFRELGSAKLEAYKGIVLLGVKEISSGMQDRLTAHLKTGKGILFFPGDNINKENINGFLTRLGVGAFRDEVRVKAGVNAAQVDLDHPVFQGVFKKNNGVRQFDYPTVYRYLRFQSQNSIVQNPIMAIDGNSPILLESFAENGVFYTFTIFPDSSWSDFPLKSSFAPLMMRLSHLMNSTQNVTQSQNLGNLIPLRVKTPDKDIITLVKQGVPNANGEAEIIPLQSADEGYIVLKFDDALITEGNYNLVQNGEVIQKISFNVPDQESKLAALDAAQMEAHLKAKGLERIRVTPPNQNEVISEIQIQKEGIPLWKFFLIAGALFLLAELFILRIGRKK